MLLSILVMHQPYKNRYFKGNKGSQCRQNLHLLLNPVLSYEVINQNRDFWYLLPQINREEMINYVHPHDFIQELWDTHHSFLITSEKENSQIMNFIGFKQPLNKMFYDYFQMYISNTGKHIQSELWKGCYNPE